MCSCYVALWLIGRVTEILKNITLIVIVEVKFTVLLKVAVILTVILVVNGISNVSLSLWSLH